MKLQQLHIHHVRSVTEARLSPDPHFNVLEGGNGAGKTSVLEAIHLLSNGKSFRGRVGEGLVQVGQPHLEVFARWQVATGRERHMGLRHTGSTWEGRLDGEPCALLSDLCTAFASVTFEPGSHALIDGRSENRRRLMDWGLFHVEPDFLLPWRRLSRALKQRNALLKQRGAALPQLDAWEAEFSGSGESVAQMRQAYLESLAPLVRKWAEQLIPELGSAQLDYVPGWKRLEMPLSDALLLSRPRDLAAGFTSVGPHRDDWRLRLSARDSGERLSRGQTKLAALAVILAQADLFGSRHGEWPVVLLDDLASELDAPHRAAVLAALATNDAQVFITGTEARDLTFPTGASPKVFHVEQGGLGEGAGT